MVYQGDTLGLVATGGAGAGYQWSLSQNASGAALTDFGVYAAGIPDASANVTDTVRVVDATGNSTTVTITVLPRPADVDEAAGGLLVGASGERSPNRSGCSSTPGLGDGRGAWAAVLSLLVLQRWSRARTARSSKRPDPAAT